MTLCLDKRHGCVEARLTMPCHMSHESFTLGPSKEERSVPHQQEGALSISHGPALKSDFAWSVFHTYLPQDPSRAIGARR